MELRRRPRRGPRGLGRCAGQGTDRRWHGGPAEDLLHGAVPLAAAPERHQRHQRPVLRVRRQDAHRRRRTQGRLRELLRLGHLPFPGPARGAGESSGRLRHRPVDDRRLRPDRALPQVVGVQRRVLRHGRRPGGSDHRRLPRLRRAELRHRKGAGRPAETGEHTEQRPAGTELPRQPGLRTPQRHVRLLQLLRSGGHDPGVRHGGLRPLRLRRCPRRHPEPADVRPSCAGLAQCAEPGLRVRPAAQRRRFLDRRFRPHQRHGHGGGRLVDLLRHGSLQRGRARRRQGRQQGDERLPRHRASQLHRRPRLRVGRQRTQHRTALGVRLHR